MQSTLRRLPAAAFLAAAVLALSAWGCGRDATVTPDTSTLDGQAPELAMDLSAPDGGVSAAAEAPGFGDPYFNRYLAEDEPVDDALDRDPRMNPLQSRPGASVLYLRIIWGNLRRGPEADDDAGAAGPVLDWSGGARVTDGLLLPKQVIAFEPNDRMVRPVRAAAEGGGIDRQVVEWISHTGGGWDGVLLKVVVPPAADTAFAADRARTPGDGLTPDDQFIFATAPLTVRFPLAAAARMDTTFMVDTVHGVSITGFDRGDLDDLCPRGAVLGTWVRVPGDSLDGGYFRARWTGPVGGIRGHMRGRWGVLEDGTQAFVGKVIGPDGAYLGHVRGTWAADDADPSHGTYRGVWVRLSGDGAEASRGRVRGGWAVNDRVEDGGLLRGEWAADCNPDSAAPGS